VDPLARYVFQTDAKKVEAFRVWLQDQVDQKLLFVDVTGKAWTSTYVQSAYKLGVIHAFMDARKSTEFTEFPFSQGSQEQFLRTSFGSAETTRKLELLYTRTFEQLRGFTGQMAQDLSRVLTEGLAHGYSASKIARMAVKQVHGLTKRRALAITRTELIHAHAEGQLDSFESLGVYELNILAEILTAGDDRVCSICAALEGEVFTIEEARGLVPLHVQCRCCWRPANVGEKLSKKTKAVLKRQMAGKE
jgi:SPP1 gp7 family putative phage head morphogenesis protein